MQAAMESTTSRLRPSDDPVISYVAMHLRLRSGSRTAVRQSLVLHFAPATVTVIRAPGGGPLR